MDRARGMRSMDPASLLLGACLSAMAAWQAVMMCSAFRRLWTPGPTPLGDVECPLALIVLCLRGEDPFLPRTLRALLSQDYPNYRVRVVLDSAEDDARRHVEAALHSAGNPDWVEVQTLRQRFDTCTYKMSGILSATQELPPGTQFVAFLDGDTVLHRSWLRELAAPIVRDGVSAATGNRWYAPQRATLANMVRVWWASSALSLMHLFRIPWGGTMAVRSDVITDEELRRRLRHAFSEDTTIGQFVAERRGVIRLVPSLIVVNREDSTLGEFLNFDARQLLTIRMQHSAWRLVSLHGVLGAMWIVFPIMRGWWDGPAWVIGAFRIAVALLCLQGILLDLTVRRVVRSRDESMPAWNPWRIVMAVCGLAALPFLHLAAALRAQFTRRIIWRGVCYRLGGKTPVMVVRDLWRPTAGQMSVPRSEPPGSPAGLARQAAPPATSLPA
jgi:glycosyltransferase involved in cell wall biosynthesis